MTTFDPTRLGEAVAYACSAHAGQFRKRASGDDRYRIPYLSHLLAVAALVIEDGGDEDEVIAALLHDVIEDQNNDDTRPDDVQLNFGARVRDLVQACTGPKGDAPGMRDFRTRKQAYLDKVGREPDAVALRVSLADKVHNARSTVNDLEADGPAMWARFNAAADDQLWYYSSLAAIYRAHAEAGRVDPARAAELSRLVARMHELTPAV